MLKESLCQNWAEDKNIFAQSLLMSNETRVEVHVKPW